MDVISEIISIEKQAEAIVDKAKLRAEEIISQANAEKEKERIATNKEQEQLISQYHDELTAKAKAHIADLKQRTDASKSALDKIMAENSEKWKEEIFTAVISV